MVERIFAEQTLTACFIEGDQAHDHFVRRRGLRECDGLLEGNAACPGMKGDVRQPELFDPACGALPPLRSGQVSLDEAEHFLHNRNASVATLRWCSGSSWNAVWHHPGMSVQLRRNLHLVGRNIIDGELLSTEAEFARREGREYETAEQLLERIRRSRNGTGDPARRSRQVNVGA